MWAARCCTWAFLSFSEVAVLGLLVVGASLVVEHGLECAGSVVVAHGLSMWNLPGPGIKSVSLADS